MATHGLLQIEKLSENEVVCKWNTHSCVLGRYHDTALTSPQFELTFKSTVYKCYFTAFVEIFIFGDPSHDAKKIEVDLNISSDSKLRQTTVVSETGFQYQLEKQKVSKMLHSISQVNSTRIFSLNSCLPRNLPIIVCKVKISDSLEFQKSLSSFNLSHTGESSRSNAENEGSQQQGKWSFFRNSLHYLSSLKSRFNCYKPNNIVSQDGNVEMPHSFDPNSRKMVNGNSLIKEKQNKIIKNPKYLIQDMTHLYFKGIMSHLKIDVDGVSLPTHKLILAARSPVFKKMLEDDYCELNHITVTDCNAQVFQKFLKYLYTDDLEHLTIEEEMELYSLAYKYEVDGLKLSCFELMRIEVEFRDVYYIADYVCNILKLAHLHNDQKLKNVAECFILRYFSIVGSGKCWKEMLKTDPELTSKVLVNLTECKISNIK